ncbi:MAG: DEAD/DEAH box helicase family protein [Treponema sp.]|jgi:superfamily II DNA or RNA helicase|nr:DEAD/DEAH box helicase family protein [Treponema sp.]
MARQKYGVTPWGKWFIEVLDSYQMGARLDRGRSYANTGKVLSLDITDKRVVAKVKGNYRPFYRVAITFPELKDKERVLKLIQEDPRLLALLAAGELPEELLINLKQEGINLIPKHWNEMKRSCNCPDDGDPCKHMAALYYIIAREIDGDPRILFQLRGINLKAIAELFGASLDRELPPPFTVEADPSPRNLPLEAPELPDLPRCTDLILSLLPSNPSFSERDFTLVLAEFYHRVARFGLWEAAEDASPEIEHTFSRSLWTIMSRDPRPGGEIALVQETVSGEKHRYTLYEAFQCFRSFSADDGTASYIFLFYLFKFLNILCTAGAFIPGVLWNKGPQRTRKNGKASASPSFLRIIWKPFDSLPLINETLNLLAAYEDRMLPLDRKSKEKTFASGRSVVNLLASAFLGEWVKQHYFSQTYQKGSADYRELLGLFFQGQTCNVSSPAMRSIPLAIDRWLSVLYIDFSAWKYRLSLKGASSRGEIIDLDFRLSMEVLLEGPEGLKKIPLKDAAQETGTIEVLKAPTALSHYLPELGRLSSKTSVRLTEERLLDFLDRASLLLSRLGIEVVFPKNLHRELKPRLVLKTSAKQAGALVNYLGLDSLLDWQWQVAIGDDILTQEEFNALVKQKKGMVTFRNTFIRLDPEELARLLKKAQQETPQISDFLKAYFTDDCVLSFDAEQIMNQLVAERSFPIPQGLNAQLRHYQERGYNWICSLLLAGFGCVLADDMGLGKTIQSITALLWLKEEGLLGNHSLIIAPAALLENWEQELSRFAPALSVSRYHGTKRNLADEHDVFLTTYQTAVRDSTKLQEHPFSLLIVDEAHLMKNADTRGAKTVKQLKSQYRLALSGTPVENRLEDMRSLFDFILPGYLGTASQFRDEYRFPIEVMRQKEKAEVLKKITAPFLLRRLKTDKNIIADLPEKITSNEYAVLEKEQAALYESIVTETMKKSEAMEEEPQSRAALVLGLLTALKQVCDHPRVYDKESPALSQYSGKAQLLLTLVESILANREKVLIFSQYVEALHCLEAIIRNELGEMTWMYHGGMAQKKRSQVIDRFQTDPSARILLVSLKAGGLGLNLTAASRVIHYDLWYNPAVENQATDRVFRIGQTRNVFVHRFITKGSFEEKIDAMLKSKRELADMTVSTGESWITRMSHEELKSLFHLR